MFLSPIILAQVGIAWLFIRYLLQHDTGPKEPKAGMWLAGVFGVLAVIPAFLLENWLLPNKFLSHPSALSHPSLLGYSFLIGLIEESAKSLPIAVLLFRKGYFDEVNDGVIYFATAGMVFGLLENIEYDIVLGPGAGIGRIIFDPYLHAGLCALFGLMLARKKVLRTTWLFVALAFLAAIALHGFYDFGLSVGKTPYYLTSIFITALINTGVFLLYKFSRKTDARLGLSAAGINFYCPHCGRPNPQRYLYCPYCGKKT